MVELVQTLLSIEIVAASMSLASDELEPLERGLSCISTSRTPSVIHQFTFGGHQESQV